MSSTVSLPSYWSPIVARSHPSVSRAHVHGALTPQMELAHAPMYVFPYCHHHTFPDSLLHWPPVPRYLPPPSQESSYSGPYGAQRWSSGSNTGQVFSTCLQCWEKPKLPDHRFCSVACAQSAACLAPALKYIPPHHETSVKIATRVLNRWRTAPRPKVLAVYMITWPEVYQRSFERYRQAVEARGQFERSGLFSGNEQKRFRGTIRSCTLGERGNLVPCHNEACWTCETIRLGFEPHLRRKRDVPSGGGGIRLGAGIYTSSTSSKADQYARNVHDPTSSIHAMLVCRVVIGRAYDAYREDPTLQNPPAGYDCVFGKPGLRSDFADEECVVYDVDAIRCAYLVLYDKAPSH